MNSTPTVMSEAVVAEEVAKLQRDKIRVAVVSAHAGSYSDYVRYALSLGSLSMQGFLDANVFKWDDLVKEDEKALRLLADADLLLLRSVGDPRAIRLMEQVRAAGVPCVIDIDDDLWNVNPCNPSYAMLGTEEYYQDAPNGERVPVWVKGDVYGGFHGSPDIPFDPERNLKTLDKIRYGIEMADLVTTTTERFAGHLRTMNQNVAVLPNPVDTTMWKVGRMPRPGFRLLWQGGDSHLLDLMLIGQAVVQFLLDHKDAIFVTCGWVPEKFRKAIPPGQHEHYEWQPAIAYPWLVMTLGADHGLAPLTGHKFNQHKSSIKWEEYGAMGVPCSASKVPPYSDTILHGTDGFLVKDGKWREHLEWVYKNRATCKQVGLEARDRVEKEFSCSRLASRWLFAYRKCINQVKVDRNPTVYPFLGGSSNPPVFDPKEAV